MGTRQEGSIAPSRGPRPHRVRDVESAEYRYLVNQQRPRLVRALEIAARRDYEEAAAEYAVLAAELAAVDRRLARLERR